MFHCRDTTVQRFEMTHGAYVAEGNPQGAAVAALETAELHSHNLAEGIAEGWVRRAEQLLTDDRDSVAKGYLLRWQSHEAFDADGDLDSALQLSRRVGEIAKINLDGSLEVLALLDQGRFLVASGRLDELATSLPCFETDCLSKRPGQSHMALTTGYAFAGTSERLSKEQGSGGLNVANQNWRSSRNGCDQGFWGSDRLVDHQTSQARGRQ